MIKRTIDIDGYWKVIIYFNVDYNLFNYVLNDLLSINTPNITIRRIFNNMSKRKAKAVTISNENFNTSIVLFNKHDSKYDYINSIVHEAEHIKQSMLHAYKIDDYGEPPAYTIGYLVMKMLMIFNSYSFN